MERPVSPRMPLWYRAINAAGRIAPRPLDPDRLISAALRAAGADRFDDETFRPALAVLIESANHEARLNPFGRLMLRKLAGGLLRGRLRLQQWALEHPAVAAEPIVAPLIIVGLPRTGTTLLHRVLALDPALRAPLTWEIERPVPPPDPANPDRRRIAAVQRGIDVGHRLAPGLEAVHRRGAELPEECQQILGYRFANIAFQHIMHLPSYRGWLLEHDFSADLRFHRSFLQHLQTGGARRRWLLKSPQHILYLPALLEVYPDAMIVQTHREPQVVMDSVSHLSWLMHRVFSDGVSARVVGDAQRAFFTTVLERCIEAREGALAGAKILDLRHSEIVSNTLDCIGRIYDNFGLACDPEVSRRREAFLRARRRGERAYSAFEYGRASLEQARVYDRYRQRYGPFGP